MTVAAPAARAPASRVAVPTQRAFRSLLKALSYPGTVVELPPVENGPETMPPAFASIAVTLLDGTTTVWLDETLRTEPVDRFLRFRCGVTARTEPAAADFAFAQDLATLPRLSSFRLGSPMEPDRSTTLIVKVAQLYGGRPIALTGPGIETRATIAPAGLRDGFWAEWRQNTSRYPSGIDLVLTDGLAVVGLPRTTRSA